MIHKDRQRYADETIRINWVFTAETITNEVEQNVVDKIGTLKEKVQL